MEGKYLPISKRYTAHLAIVTFAVHNSSRAVRDVPAYDATIRAGSYQGPESKINLFIINEGFRTKLNMRMNEAQHS